MAELGPELAGPSVAGADRSRPMPEILEVEAARAVLEARALDREIASVHAPDTWFLKRGTTPESVTHALVGNQFTAARRRGKSMFVDTADGMCSGCTSG